MKPSVTSSPLETRIPVSFEAELAVLGACLVHPPALEDARRIVRDALCFTIPDHRTVWEAICALAEQEVPVDMVSLSDWLKRNLKQPEDYGRVMETVIKAADDMADVRRVDHHCRILLDRFHRRTAMAVGERVMRLACDLTVKPEAVIIEGLAGLDGVLGSDPTGMITVAQDVVRSFRDELSDPERFRRFVRSGVPALDEIGGIPLGALTILAARPSVGKSSLGLQFAVHGAAFSRVSALFVSVEMKAQDVAARIVGQVVDTSVSGLLRDGMVPSEAMAHCDAAIVEMDCWAGKLWIANDVDDIRDVVDLGRRCSKQGCKMLVVDYLQLCDPGERHENRNLEVASMSAKLKRLSKRTGMAVVVLSQLNREVERTTRKPGLSDLRDSGAIEQDADLVFMLYRQSDDGWTVDLKVAKNRNGPLLETKLMFDPRRMVFGGENHLTRFAARVGVSQGDVVARFPETAAWVPPVVDAESEVPF